MSLAEGITTLGTQEAGDIFARNDNWSSLPIVVVSGEGALKRGCILGKITASGKYKAWKSTANDGSEVIDAVLGEDIDATSGDVKTYAFVKGEFLKSKLTAGTGQTITAGQYKSANIIIREEIY